MRLLAPAFAAACLFALPLRAEVPLEELTSPEGTPAWLVEEGSLPFTAIELRFEGGTTLDADETQGAINLMAQLMDQGAGDLDAQDFATAREDLGMRLSVSASRDEVSVSARFLTENRDESIELLRTALAEPRFDDDAIERARAQVISGIRSDLRDPDELASRAFYEAAFGDHPYGRSGKGTEDSVAALDRDDLLDAHGRAFGRDRVHVGAAGDIDAETLGAVIDRLLADLPETGAEDPGAAQVALEGGIEVVEFDGPQASILFGHSGIARDDDDFITAFVTNQILGGGRFGTRLMSELREERGLTYGVHSRLQPMRHGALMMGSLSTDHDNVEQVISLVREEWQKMAAEGPTDDELDSIITYLTGSFPLQFDGNAAIARILADFQMQGLDADYIAERNDLVSGVTLDEARAVAERILDPEGLFFVVTGQPSEELGAED